MIWVENFNTVNSLKEILKIYLINITNISTIMLERHFTITEAKCDNILNMKTSDPMRSFKVLNGMHIF